MAVISKKTLFESLISLIISIIVGTFLLCISYELPTEKIFNNVKESYLLLKNETNYYSVTSTVSGSIQDNVTDAIYLNEALINNEYNGFFTSLYGYNYLTKKSDDSPVAELSKIFEENNRNIEPSKYRFWNGWELVLKILLQFFDYSNIRYLNLILQSSLMFLLLYLMHRKGLNRYELPLLILYLFINPFAMALTMAYSGYYYCMIVPCIIILLFNDWLNKEDRYYIFFELIGVATFYFNMNYIQLMTFAVPYIFVLLVNGFPKTIKKAVFHTLRYGVFWFVGYSGMMIGKWIIFYLCTGSNIFIEMLDVIIFRTSSGYGKKIHRYNALLENIFVAISNIWNVLIEFIFIFVIIIGIYKKKNRLFKKNSVDIFVIIESLIAVIVRYIIFANHTIIHSFVTYRLIGIFLFTMNVVLIRIYTNDRRYLNE